MRFPLRLSLFIALLPVQVAAQDSVQFYDLTAGSDPTVFSVVEHWDEKEDPVTHPVTDIDLSLSLWGGEGDIMDALTVPNGLTADEWLWEWFSAGIDVVADGRMFRGGWGRCSRWEDDLTYCTMDGDGGTFLIEREISKAEIRLHLIMRLWPEDIEDYQENGGGHRPYINVRWPENGYSASMVLPDGIEGRVTFVLPLYQ